MHVYAILTTVYVLLGEYVKSVKTQHGEVKFASTTFWILKIREDFLIFYLKGFVDWIVFLLTNSYAEALDPYVTIFGDMFLKRKN